MTPIPRRLPDALAQSEAGSALLQRYSASQRAATAIQAECQNIVPEFDPARSGGCELRGTTLRVNARHPAQVAKLRQAVPRLLRILKQQGFDVIEIKIGVQPRALSSSDRHDAPGRAAAGPGEAAIRRKLASQFGPALEFAKKLALTLPDSPLRAAARRMAASLSVGLARMRESDQAGDQQHTEEDEA